MADVGLEFMSKMESTIMGDPREQAAQQLQQQQGDPVSFLEASHCMRDFWLLNTRTGASDHQSHNHRQHAADADMQKPGARGGQASYEEEYSHSGYGTGVGHHVHNSIGAAPADHSEPVTARVEAQQLPRAQSVTHDVVYYANLCHPAYPAPIANAYYCNAPHPSSALPAYNISPHTTTYTNFLAQDQPRAAQYFPSSSNRTDQSNYHYTVVAPIPVPPGSNSPTPFGSYSSGALMSTSATASWLTPSENINRDMESLRQELAFKCPRSNDLLTAITTAAQATVQNHARRSSTHNDDDEDDEDDDDDDDDDDHPQPPRLFPLSQVEQADQELRAAIVEHPFYTKMVVAHIRIFKIGAPKELRSKLDDVGKKFQRFQEGDVTRLGDDPTLDYFMSSYVDLLGKLGNDMEEPFTQFMQFKDATTKQLEDICGHYVETAPDETDNYGYDIKAGGFEPDELDRMKEVQNMMHPFNEIDESIVIDPELPDGEIRKKLMQKFGSHIGGLKAEFNRVRKKGKLPSQARNVLKDWFDRHSYWPYPSEAEKQYLQQMCTLNLKQINNWFINERKRHWSCEGKCMHPNAKFYHSPAGLGGDKSQEEE